MYVNQRWNTEVKRLEDRIAHLEAALEQLEAARPSLAGTPTGAQAPSDAFARAA